jgi:acetate kinase
MLEKWVARVGISVVLSQPGSSGALKTILIAMANILVLNAGSGSQKLALYSITLEAKVPSAPLWQAGINSTTPGQPEGYLVAQIASANGQEEILVPRDSPLPDKLATLIQTSWMGRSAVLKGSGEIDLVGHRVVHGGLGFTCATLINPQVESTIQKLADLAPLHNPHSLAGISACREILGRNLPQFAVFDTAFHRTLPEAAATYAGPFEWLEKGWIRYGFHGTSFRYANRKAAEIINRQDDEELCQILCHLGGGCSLAAVRGTRCLDTTMGFTPMDGIAMCTRSGAIDPGLILYLLRQGTDLDSLEKILNKQSGLSGLSGLPGDTRIIFPEARQHHRRAELARDVFIHRLRSGVGSMLASLGRLDALVFTDVIGETEPMVRERVCEAFPFLNLRLDPKLNSASPPDTDISSRDSSVRVLIIRSQENWQIAAESIEAWRDTAGERR